MYAFSTLRRDSRRENYLWICRFYCAAEWTYTCIYSNMQKKEQKTVWHKDLAPKNDLLVLLLSLSLHIQLVFIDYHFIIISIIRGYAILHTLSCSLFLFSLFFYYSKSRVFFSLKRNSWRENRMKEIVCFSLIFLQSRFLYHLINLLLLKKNLCTKKVSFFSSEIQ